MNDGLTADVLRGALTAAAEEASIVVVRSAYSAFIVEGSDACAGILDAHGRLVANSMATSLAHSSSLRSSLPAVVETYPLGSMRPGDVFAMNDVYRGGIHANDILVFRPVYVDGRATYFVATLIHIADMGGTTAAGITSLATEIWHEGIQLPPVRIATVNGFNDELVRTLALNSRLPDTTLGDLRALVAGANVAARRLDALLTEYGADGLARGIDECIAHTERLMRHGIAEFPDGVYKASYQLDDDGLHPGRSYTIAVNVTIDGERAIVDFSGTDEQVAASINSGLSQTLSGALFGLRCFLDPTIPMNEGCFTAVEFRVPEGSLLNVSPPYPGGGRFLAVFAAVEAIFQALSRARPDRAIAASGLLQPFAFIGRRDDGTTWLHTAYDFGGMGARAGKDGLDAVGVHHGGGRNAIPQTEPVESQFPLIVEEVSLIPDSGGPGRWRGGQGTRTVFRLLTDALLSMRTDRLEHPPIGLDGAQSGRGGGYYRVRPDGTTIALPAKSAGVALVAGDRLIMESSGGGGLRAPFERAVDAVARDVANGRVSVDAARRDYAVVVDELGVVNQTATASIRTSMRSNHA